MDGENQLPGSQPESQPQPPQPEQQPQPQSKPQAEVKPEAKAPKKKINLVVVLTSVGAVVFLILSVWFYVAKGVEWDKRMVAEKKLEQTLVAKRIVERSLRERTQRNEELVIQVQDLGVETAVMKKQIVQLNKEKGRLTRKAKANQKEMGKIKDLLESEKSEKMALAEGLREIQGDYTEIEQKLTSLEKEKERLEGQLQQATIVQQSPMVFEQKEPAVNLGTITVGEESIPAVKPPWPPPQVASSELSGKMGRILVVNDEFNFVVVSFGKNDGLKVGEVLNIYRDEALIGTVQVEKLYEAIAAATMLDGGLGLYQEGDVVKL